MASYGTKAHIRVKTIPSLVGRVSLLLANCFLSVRFRSIGLQTPLNTSQKSRAGTRMNLGVKKIEGDLAGYGFMQNPMGLLCRLFKCTLFTRIKEEGINVYFVKTPVEFGLTGEV